MQGGGFGIPEEEEDSDMAAESAASSPERNPDDIGEFGMSRNAPGYEKR